MNFYDTSITFVYRNGSEFTEHYAKPLNLGQLVDACLVAAKRQEAESNIVDVVLRTEKVDTRS